MLLPSDLSYVMDRFPYIVWDWNPRTANAAAHLLFCERERGEIWKEELEKESMRCCVCDYVKELGESLWERVLKIKLNK